MMDYFEALPKRTIKQLLDDDELTDFVSDYEKQIFDQETVFGRGYKIESRDELWLETDQKAPVFVHDGL